MKWWTIRTWALMFSKWPHLGLLWFCGHLETEKEPFIILRMSTRCIHRIFDGWKLTQVSFHVWIYRGENTTYLPPLPLARTSSILIKQMTPPKKFFLCPFGLKTPPLPDTNTVICSIVQAGSVQLLVVRIGVWCDSWILLLWICFISK